MKSKTIRFIIKLNTCTHYFFTQLIYYRSKQWKVQKYINNNFLYLIHAFAQNHKMAYIIGLVSSAVEYPLAVWSAVNINKSTTAYNLKKQECG